MTDCKSPEGRVTVTAGRDKSFRVYLVKADGRPQPIDDWSLIRLSFTKADNSLLHLYADVSPGEDEQQTILAAAAPVSGAFKIQAGDETTGVLAFNATATDVQTALRALRQFSDLTVTGASINAGFEVMFIGNDGLRAQPLLTVIDSTLLDAMTEEVEVETTVDVAGEGKNGVEVLSVERGELAVFLNEAQASTLKVGLNQTISILARIGALDLDVQPLGRILDVLAG